MAEAYKCDICGGLYEERPDLEQDVTWFLFQITVRGYVHKADMCQNCLDNLQLWVKNKGRGENNIVFDLRQKNIELEHCIERYSSRLEISNNRIEELETQLRDAEARIRMGVINDQGRC